MRPALPLALLLAACGGLFTGARDAGAGGGGNNNHNGGGAGGASGGGISAGGGGDAVGGGSTAGGGGAVGGGSTGGGGTAGGTATGGGNPAGGGAATGPYTFDTVLNGSNGGGGADEGSIVAISGRTGEIWAASTDGIAYRSTDGTNFTRLPPLDPSFNHFESIYVAPDGAVFIIAGSKLGVCTTGCTTMAGFTWTTFSQRYEVLCGSSSTNVFAIGYKMGPYIDGVMQQYTASGWGAEVTLPVTHTRSCFMASDGTLWIGGDEKLIRRPPSGTPLALEGADLSVLGSEASGQGWYAIFGIDGWIHAVGWQRRAMSMNPQGMWRFSYDANDSNGLHAVAAVRSDEVFAGGWPGPPPQRSPMVKFDGGQWSEDSKPLSLAYITAAWVADGNTIYFGGSGVTGSAFPVIERATRR